MKTFLNLIIAMGLILSSCNNKQVASKHSPKNYVKDCLPDSTAALNKGKELLIEKYGNMVLTDHTFKAVLSDDSIWHVIAKVNVFENEPGNDTMTIYRGSEMVLINKHNCHVIGFSIAR